MGSLDTTKPIEVTYTLYSTSGALPFDEEIIFSYLIASINRKITVTKISNVLGLSIEEIENRFKILAEKKYIYIADNGGIIVNLFKIREHKS